MTPKKFGRYEIKAELGRGGMATVYRAYDPSFDREVALKVLPREMLHDPQFRGRFEREIKTVAALEHPAIVPVYDVGEEEGQPYFVMRYMAGGSLSSWIAKGKFSLQDTARIIERLAQALAYAHKKGIVHRDLKPDNVLFDSNGDAFISDFGVAKLAESASSLTGSGIIGTPAYMSPEQAQGTAVDGRSDIYGLGVIVYQMLSGKQPYNADTPMGVVVKHITEPVPEILKVTPGLPEEVDTIIKTAMAKDKAQRYDTATGLSKALTGLAFGTEGTATSAPLTRVGGAPVSAAPSKGRTGFVIAGVIVLLALVGVFLFRNQIFGSTSQEQPPVAPVVVTATHQASTPTVAPSLETAPVSTTAAFAPFCQPDTLQVATPIVTETNKDCIRKAPFTTISIPPGSTFESQDPEFSCKRIEGNDTLITCTGKELFSFDLKVCSPPSFTPAAGSDAGKCPEGAVYNAANQCCVKPPAEDAGCTIFKVDLKSCSQ